MIQTRYVRALLAAAAVCAAAPGCRITCVSNDCQPEQAEVPPVETADCEAKPAEKHRLAGRMQGRVEELKARAHEHFHEEPVVAPHSRFHPVPTRPVFEAASPEELAALFPPPGAEKDAAAKAATGKDGVQNPSQDTKLDATKPVVIKAPELLPTPDSKVNEPAANTPITTHPSPVRPARPVTPDSTPAPTIPSDVPGTPKSELPAAQPSPAEPPDSPEDPPTRTAKQPATEISSVDVPALNIPSLNAANPEVDPSNKPTASAAAEVRSTFRQTAAEEQGASDGAGKKPADPKLNADKQVKLHAPEPAYSGPPISSFQGEHESTHTLRPLALFGNFGEPLLWRAVKTPSGSLRAVPATFVEE